VESICFIGDPRQHAARCLYLAAGTVRPARPRWPQHSDAYCEWRIDL